MKKISFFFIEKMGGDESKIVSEISYRFTNSRSKNFIHGKLLDLILEKERKISINFLSSKMNTYGKISISIDEIFGFPIRSPLLYWETKEGKAFSLIDEETERRYHHYHPRIIRSEFFDELSEKLIELHYRLKVKTNSISLESNGDGFLKVSIFFTAINLSFRFEHILKRKFIGGSSSDDYSSILYILEDEKREKAFPGSESLKKEELPGVVENYFKSETKKSFPFGIIPEYSRPRDDSYVYREPKTISCWCFCCIVSCKKQPSYLRRRNCC